ncbi:MAG: helix-turn-helix domain-containing protein [Candidatus Hydrogenedentes bacterium]|nr:helix-turn-helix domain-containing protein [Candidatus Hydrogenedentota bacterium]MBI3118159.1 helix-turn-helix domain-containing protein [Candidatus Hydrogenedentota bacterium]
MEKILTVDDVARVLQVKAITVREMFRQQRLRGFKMGKAWRTTEQLLKEDIATLIKGAPSRLNTPANGGGATKQKARRTSKVSKEKTAPPSEKVHDPQAVAVSPGKSRDAVDDTQQLLF